MEWKRQTCSRWRFDFSKTGQERRGRGQGLPCILHKDHLRTTGAEPEPQTIHKTDKNLQPTATLSAFTSNILRQVFSPFAQNLPSIVLPVSFMFSTINSAKYQKMRKRGVLFTLLPRVCETPAGTYTTDLCCKWYRSFWIYSSAKVSSSLAVGSPIARSRNSDGQRLCCLKDKRD